MKASSAIVKGMGGFSLPEVMVSVAIIGITALGVSRLFVTGVTGSKKVNQASACTNHLNSVMNRIRGLGARIEINDFLWGLNPVNRWATEGMASGDVVTEGSPAGATFNPLHRFPQNAAYDITTVPAVGNPVFLQNAHLIRGIMGGMLAIYNSNNGAYCGTAGGAVYNSDLFTAASGDQILKNLQTTIQIRPFNLDTGAVVPCVSPLIIAPRGNPNNMSDMMTTGRAAPLDVGQGFSGPRIYDPVACPANSTQVAVAPQGGVYCDTQGGIGFGPNVRNNLGLVVTLNASYQDANLVPSGCTAEMRLQYPEDNGVPPAPVIRIYENSTWASNFSGMASGPRSGPTSASVQYRSMEFQGQAPSGPMNATHLHVNCVARNVNQVSIDIGYTVANTKERGTVLLCRNRSYKLPPPEASGYFSSCNPGSGGDPGPQYPPSRSYPSPGVTVLPWNGAPIPQRTVPATPGVDGYKNYLPLNPVSTFDVPYLTLNGWNAAHPLNTLAYIPDGDNTWVPCDRLQLCDAGPPVITNTFDQTQKWSRLAFTNLTSGCVMQLDARTVDTAGNMSSIATMDHTQLLGSTHGNQPLIVEFPRCGLWCNAIGATGTPGAGHFTCDGACP